MQITTTAKIQIQVAPEQRELLDATMDTYRSACNFVANYIFQTHDLKQRSLNKVLYYDLRERFGLKSQMAQSVFKTVIARYKTILENQHEWIKPDFSKPQYDLVWNRDYSLTQNLFSVNTLDGRVKLPYFADGMEKYFDHDAYSFGTAKLVKKHGKYFLHIPVTTDVPKSQNSDICNVVGVDRGINFVVATYDSKHKSGFVSGKAIKQKRAKYKELRKELQQRQTPSARRRLKAIGQRENRWMQDVNHCISKALVTNNPLGTLFVLEDLRNIRSALTKTQSKHRHTALSWAYFDLERKLIYKALRNHQLVERVSPAYSSQTCPKCGHTSRGNRNNRIHHFCCKNCGYNSNDDRAAAMNLHRRGIELLFLSAVATE